MIRATRQLFENRDLLVTLIERHLRLRVKRSWMGIIWPTLFPFILAMLYVYVFKRVLEVPIPLYTEYLLCGLIPWVFFQQAATRGMASISAEPEIIAKAPFPHALLPMSAVATHALNMFLALGIFIGYLAVVGRLQLGTLIALVPPVVCVILFTMAFTMVLALVDVYNQDLRSALPFILTVWFFLVPVVYRPQMAPEVVRRILIPEPMHLVINHFRAALYRGRFPKLYEVGVMVVVSIVSFVGAAWLLHRASARLPEDV